MRRQKQEPSQWAHHVYAEFHDARLEERQESLCATGDTDVFVLLQTEPFVFFEKCVFLGM